MARGDRFIAGDPLRGLAALLVFAFHLALPVLVMSGGTALGSVATHALASLQVAIYVFFALSGYLLSRPFIAAFHAGERGPATGPYLERRLRRIAPAFWVVTLIVLIRFGTRGSGAGDVIAVFGFVQTYHEGPFTELMVQGWTLGAELLFYMLLPVGAAVLAATLGRRPASRSRLLTVAAVLGGIALVIFVVRVTGDHAHNDRFTPPVMLFAFAPGIALAAADVLWRPAVPGAAVTVAGVVLLVLYAAIDREHVAIRSALAVLGSTAVVAGPLAHQWRTGRAWGWIDNPFMNWAGERSYSIYLLHVAVIVQFGAIYREHGAWTSLALISLVAIPVTFVLAEILHRLVERPLLVRRGG